MAPCTKDQCLVSCGSTSKMACLTNDLLIEILSRLPVKTLLLCKCVSKEWQFLISHFSLQGRLPTTMHGLFYQTLLPCSRQHRRILECEFECSFVNDDARIDITNLTFFPHYRQVSVLDCCNGLLLCGSSTDNDEGVRYLLKLASVYYVLNPATKKWTRLPPPPKHYLGTATWLAFDPRVSPHYKVIRLNATPPAIDIFSSKTGVWKRSEVPRKWCSQLDGLGRATFLNRSLHVLRSSNLIVGFNVDKKCLRSIRLPGPSSLSCLQICLGASQGHLHYARCNSSLLRIWMLEDYNSNEWILKHETSIISLVEKHREVSFSSEFNYCSRYSDHANERFPGDKHTSTPNPPSTHRYELVDYISKRRYLERFCVLDFHPDFDVIFLGIEDEIVSYHLKSRRLGEVRFKHPIKGILHWWFVQSFSPCMIDSFGFN